MTSSNSCYNTQSHNIPHFQLLLSRILCQAQKSCLNLTEDCVMTSSDVMLVNSQHISLSLPLLQNLLLDALLDCKACRSQEVYPKLGRTAVNNYILCLGVDGECHGSSVVLEDELEDVSRQPEPTVIINSLDYSKAEEDHSSPSSHS